MNRFHQRSKSLWLLLTLLVGATLLLLPDDTSAVQQAQYLHMNPVIEKLEQGLHVFGVSTSDLSLQNARSLANADIDYVYLDMEHNPLRFEQMEYFMAFIAAAGRAETVRRGTMQAHPAVFARFPPYANEDSQWMYKLALDLGLMGIITNNLETPEQAAAIVHTMRPRQLRDSMLPSPPGYRGTIACGFWAPPGECRSRADVWPLNPQGDLIFWPMIETIEGVMNAEAIARVPGVSGLYLGAFNDLSASIGIAGQGEGDREVETAIEQIMSVCRNRDLACGGSVNEGNAARRINQGYTIINFGGSNGGLTAGNAAARDASIAAGVRR